MLYNMYDDNNEHIYMYMLCEGCRYEYHEAILKIQSDYANLQ